jgi:hypothetical protein
MFEARADSVAVEAAWGRRLGGVAKIWADALALPRSENCQTMPNKFFAFHLLSLSMTLSDRGDLP